MNPKRAFTTIELLLATSLAAIMMVGVLRVVGSIRPHLDSTQDTHDTPWSGELIELLRWDLNHTRTIWQQNNQLTLIGYAALQRSEFGWRIGSGESSLHEPVEIQYELWPDEEGHNWLLRRQTHTSEPTNRNTWSEVIVHNIHRFELRRPDGMPQGSEPGSTDIWLNQPGSVPDRVRLVVQLRDQNSPAIDELIMIR